MRIKNVGKSWPKDIFLMNARKQIEVIFWNIMTIKFT